MIDFVNVTKKFTYRGHPIAAVSELTMTVPDGGIVALVGPNGAGKTTVLRMLTTVMKPTEGRITVQGFDTRTRAQAVRKMIGYVPQSGSVTTGSRVREELVFHGALMGMTAAKARARANDLIENFDLREQAERQIQQLSGGQRRRVNLALALMHWPQVVIFDEPTVGLDPLSRAQLWESIHALRESFGVTVVMSTHYLEEAAALADQVALIDHGTMIATDTPAKLVSRYASDSILLEFESEAEAQRASIALPAEYGESVREGKRLRVTVSDAGAAAPELATLLAAQGCTVTRLETSRGTLDDAFFALTGRNFHN